MTNLKHIRNRAAKSPWGISGPAYMRYLEASFENDPMRKTMCGKTGEDNDLSWADTRWAKYLAEVTCADCIERRTLSSGALNK